MDGPGTTDPAPPARRDASTPAPAVQRTSARIDGRAYAYLRLLEECVRAHGTRGLGAGAAPHLDRHAAPLSHAAVIGAALRALLEAVSPELVALLDRAPEADLLAQLDPLLRAARAMSGGGQAAHDTLHAAAAALFANTPAPETNDP